MQEFKEGRASETTETRVHAGQPEAETCKDGMSGRTRQPWILYYLIATELQE